MKVAFLGVGHMGEQAGDGAREVVTAEPARPVSPLPTPPPATEPAQGARIQA